MMTTIYNNIHSLEDIHKRKLRLKKKLSVIEKSISDNTDVAKLLFNTNDGLSSLFAEKDSKLEITGYLLPLGIKYIIKQIQKSLDRKHYKTLIIYTVLGSVSAFLVYQYMKHRETKTE